MTENIQKLLNADVAIFGGGVSARAVARLLDKLGVGYEIYFESAGESGNAFTEQSAKKHSLAVYSPAFRPDHKWLVAARQNGLETLCEPDFAALFWNGKVVSISGTNGKTTLTAFLTQALKNANLDAFSAGNIGTPLSDFCADFFGRDNSDKIAVCEMSSFQSAALENLRSDAFVWTNFDADHLDWHLSMDEYFSVKLNISKLLKEPVFVAGKSVFAYAFAHSVELPDFALQVEPLNPDLCPPPFNTPVQAENFSLAKALWKKLCLKEKILFDTAENFKLAHYRFGEKTEFDQVEFLNDSKATNVHAAKAAILSMKGRNLVWIGGGKNKNCDLSELEKALGSNAKKAYLIGQTADMLKNLLQDALPLGAQICASLPEAVQLAFQTAKQLGKNDCGKPAVLFSPAFSSFGMFSGYSERGKVFENAVFDLKNLKNKQL